MNKIKLTFKRKESLTLFCDSFKTIGGSFSIIENLSVLINCNTKSQKKCIEKHLKRDYNTNLYFL